MNDDTLFGVIEIAENETETSLKIDMPVWIREGKGEDNNLYAFLPFFGLTTYGSTQEDLDTAIEEALICFFKAAKQFGGGIDKELKAIGWEKNTTLIAYTTQPQSRFSVHNTTPMFSEMAKTGERMELCVQI